MKVLSVLTVALVQFIMCCQLVYGCGNGGDPASCGASDPLNASYLIEDETVRLVDGVCEQPVALSSATKTKILVFGKPVRGDIDCDGDEDAAVIIVHDPGGSGTFVYGAVALNVNNRYHGSNAVLVGDRIIPKSVAIREGVIVVTYLDRQPGNPMSAAPSVERLTCLGFDHDTLEVVSPCSKND